MGNEFFTVTISNKYVDVEAKRKEFKSIIACLVLAILSVPLMFLSQNLNTKGMVQEEVNERQNQQNGSINYDEDIIYLKDVNTPDNNVDHLALNNSVIISRLESVKVKTLYGDEADTENPNVLNDLNDRKSSSIDDTKDQKTKTTEIKSAKKTKNKKKVVKEKKKKKKTNNTTKYRYIASDYEYNILLNIVEAEVTGNGDSSISYDEIMKCKLRVAQVILNRVESSKFPNTIEGVVFAPNQFSPISDGRYGTLEITDATREAVEKALDASTKDYTCNAKYFALCDFSSWATYLFTDPVGHNYYS